jgi:hypothetical protein
MSEHLTDIPSARLRPVHILQAAEADLRLFERKQEHRADPEHHYSFLNRHVRRAAHRDDAVYLIALAYFDRLPTNKPSTAQIYGDRDLLRRTLIALLQGADENTLRNMMEE